MQNQLNSKQKEICDGLVAMGAPPEVAEYAALREPSLLLYSALNFGYIGIMAAGFIVGAMFWTPLEKIAESNARAAAVEIDALLYEINFGIAMIIAIFGWIFASGIIAYALAGHFEKARLAIFTHSSLDAKSRLLIKLELFTEKHGPFLSPKHYIDTWWRVSTRILVVPSVVLFILVGMTLERELNAYVLISREKIIEKPLLPYQRVKHFYWTEAESVELGCNYIEDDKEYSLVYQVRFKTGAFRRLDGATPVDGNWLSTIELIDAELVEKGLLFKRWQWLRRDPLHPLCLAGFRRELSLSEYQRLETILRIKNLD